MDVTRVLLVWAIPLILLFAMRRETSRHRSAKETGDGKVVFELDQITYWSWLALFVYLLYAVVVQFVGGPFRVASVWVALVLLLLAVGLMMPFPETITAGPDGLVQEIRFWLKKKKIVWSEVQDVRATKKNKLLIVTGVNGTKIVHNRQLPDRDRLLEELYKNCGDKVPEALRPVAAVVKKMAEAEPEEAERVVPVEADPVVEVDPVMGADPAVEG